MRTRFPSLDDVRSGESRDWESTDRRSAVTAAPSGRPCGATVFVAGPESAYSRRVGPGAAIVTPSTALEAAPRWRREPYIVFFPLGLLISWAGVGRWLTIALTGRYEDYVAVYIFHGIAQIEGFLLSFAIGFLFTMIPRRSGTWPPSPLEMATGIAAPLFTVAAAWNQSWAASQIGWIAACLLLVTFVLRRFLSASARRRPPASFVWIPVALLLGLTGSIMTGAGGALGADWMWLHDLGRHFVLQGVFVSLVLGVGGLALPLMTRGEAPPDSSLSSRDLLVIGAHLVAAALLVASFFVQQSVSIRAGCGLRAAVIAAELAFGAGLWRLPSVAGSNRRTIWLAAWLIPAGFAFAALFPDWYQAGLHVSFVGGFAMLTLAVSTHVILGHGDRSDLLRGQPWQVAAIAILMLAATAARAAMTIDAAHRSEWMAIAAVFFLLATFVWASFLVPLLGLFGAGRR